MQLNSEIWKLDRRCQRYADYSGASLTTTITQILDNAVLPELNEGFFSWLVKTNQGFFALYGYLSVNATGIATQIGGDNCYTFYRNEGADAVLKKLGSDVKVVTKAVNYPFAGVNGEQTVDFTVDFGAVSGYTLAYAGITALDTFMSNGTIKYVQFSNLRISGTTATWSVHTARGTGYGNNGCTVQGIFIPA